LVKKTIPAGELTKEQFIKLGGTPSDFGVMDIGKQKLSDPLTYVPAALGAVTGAFNDPYEYMKSQRLAQQQTQDLEIIL
jgi:hypothetical protein